MSQIINELLTVIIPTLNEAEHLPDLLSDLADQRNISLEIIVSDGGSTDRTADVVAAHGSIHLSAPKGRGAQMNAAALISKGKYLLFMHADSRIDAPDLLSKAMQALLSEEKEQAFTAGHFPLKFIRRGDENEIAYRYAEEKTAFNRMNTTNGDQGLLLSREFFSQLGGFDESMPFLEDQRIAEKIRSTGKWITLPGFLKTSARRFEVEGFHRRYILMSIMMGLHSVGADEFFIRSPGIYKTQQETGRLLLTPYFNLIRRMMIDDWGFTGSIRTFYLLGRYIRKNSWQMFYFFDIRFRKLLGAKRYPFLKFHDRIFAPLTNFKLFDAITGALCMIWFMGVLAIYFRIVENNQKS